MKLAIIGASYLQVPLIQRARDLGHETFVFAWAAGDPGETLADHFIPISIVEKEQILAHCRTITIDGICSIASDLAMVTVGYVAHTLGLPGNSPGCILRSTNKHAMRLTFEKRGDPSPRSLLVSQPEDAKNAPFQYPVIVKPLDRSGSRGITRVDNPADLTEAVSFALEQGFEKKALIEEFAEGKEYSIEGISWKGKHRILAVTEKYTTGSPYFIESGHMEPSGLNPETLSQVQNAVLHALDSLGIENGASHSEVKIDADGSIRIIEIGARMGGDLIGSHLVPLTTGYDYVGDVIRCALGQMPEAFLNIKSIKPVYPAAAVRFIFDSGDLAKLNQLKQSHREYLLSDSVHPLRNLPIRDSSARFGYYLMCGPSRDALSPWMPTSSI